MQKLKTISYGNDHDSYLVFGE